MPGPCSLPQGDKRLWQAHNEIVCDIHFHCTMETLDKNNNVIFHDYIPYRLWLARRGRLTTGKT